MNHATFVFDAHCDTLGCALPGEFQRDLRQWSDAGHLDLPRMRAGGINCQIFACFPGQTRLTSCPTAAALERLEVLYTLIERVPEQITLIRSASDLEKITHEGPIGAILGLEGCEALDGSISRLHTFYRLGLRNLGLAWDERNAACDGVGAGTSAGLTAFGRDIVTTCNDLGIVLDLSHLNPAGVAEVLALSSQPVIASHSNARGLYDHHRNLSDNQIRMIAERGGVIGVTFVGMFMADNPAEATLDHVLDHIDYMVEVAGNDHVGLGSDYDGWTLPTDLDSGEKYPRITDGLLARGYPEETICNIMGENFRHVFTQILP